MKKVSKKLLESVISLSILNVINIALPLITLPHIINTVGMANYGIYSVVNSLLLYSLTISNYGFNFSTTKQIAQIRNNHNRINIVVNATLTAKLILSCCSLVIFTIIAFFTFSDVHAIMFILGFGIVIADVINPIWLFQGMEKMKYMIIVNVLSKFIFTILIFILIKSQSDFVYIPLINSVGQITSGILSLIIAFKVFNISLNLPMKRDVVFQLKSGWHMFVSTLSMDLYRNSNVFILGIFTNDLLTGIYASAEKIIRASQSVASPISNALFPHLANSFLNHTIKENINTILSISKKFAVLLILISLFVILFAESINNILLNRLVQDPIPHIRLMAPIIVFGGLNYLLGIVGLVNLGFQSYFFRFVLIAGVCSIVFLISTINSWEVFSASIAMVIAEVLLFVLCSYKLYIIQK